MAGLRQKGAPWPIRVALSMTFLAALKGTGVHAGWRGSGGGGGKMAPVLSFEEQVRLHGGRGGPRGRGCKAAAEAKAWGQQRVTGRGRVEGSPARQRLGKINPTFTWPLPFVGTEGTQPGQCARVCMWTVSTCVHLHTPAGHAVVRPRCVWRTGRRARAEDTSYTQCPGESCSKVEGRILEVSGIGSSGSPWTPVCEAHSSGFRVCFVSVLWLDEKLAIPIPLQDG